MSVNTIEQINELMDHLDALHAKVDLPEGPITAFDSMPDVHVYTVYDGGKIQYRVVLNLTTHDVMTLKYTNDGSLILPIVLTGSVFHDMFADDDLE